MNFSNTYLYKLRAVTNGLEQLFDRTLRRHAGYNLSQFMVLLALDTHGQINQRRIAHYLQLSPAAVKRQADIVRSRGWTEVVGTPARGETLQLTAEGKAAMQAGIDALEQHAFAVFDDHDCVMNLMGHIDRLRNNIKEVQRAQTTVSARANLM